MKELKVIFTLHDALTDRPARSMDVLALMQYGEWAKVPYSKKHGAFNVRDRYEDTSTAVPVIFWSELPTITAKDFGIDPYSEAYERLTSPIPEPAPEPDPVSHMREYSIEAEEPNYKELDAQED